MTKQDSLIKDVEVVQKNTSKALAAAQELKITDEASMATATEILSKINQAGDMMKKKKDSVVKPLNESLKNIRAMFAPAEEQFEQAKKTISQKMIAYHNEQAKKEAEEKAKLAARVEKGTLKPETAVRKMEAMPTVQNKVSTTSGSVTFKEQKTVVIENAELIPRQYLVPDMVAIRKAALAGMVISGVRVEIVKNLANHR